MKSYIEFLNEGFMFEKKIKKHILITTAVTLTAQSEYKKITTELAQILFDKYSTNKYYIKKEDEEEIAQLGNDRPILYMTSNNDDYWLLGLKNLEFKKDYFTKELNRNKFNFIYLVKNRYSYDELINSILEFKIKSFKSIK